MEFKKEKWSFKERLQFSSIIWLIAVLAFFAPNKTMEVASKEIRKLKRGEVNE